MTVRRAVLAGAALVLALSLATPQAQSGQQGGGLPGLQIRVQALEQMVADLGVALDALAAQVSSLQTSLATLEGRVSELEDGGLTSYDGMAGLPCTTAMGAAGAVHLIGVLRSPVCAAGQSADGRFVDFGPVVIDTQTGLMWEKKDQLEGLHDLDNTYTWHEATGDGSGGPDPWIGQVNAEFFGGFSDWRVPTGGELVTILRDCGAGSPCIDPVFSPTQAAGYWTSTVVTVGLYAASLDFSDGSKDLTNLNTPLYVRAVRSWK